MQSIWLFLEKKKNTNRKSREISQYLSKKLSIVICIGFRSIEISVSIITYLVRTKLCSGILCSNLISEIMNIHYGVFWSFEDTLDLEMKNWFEQVNFGKEISMRFHCDIINFKSLRFRINLKG